MHFFKFPDTVRTFVHKSFAWISIISAILGIWGALFVTSIDTKLLLAVSGISIALILTLILGIFVTKEHARQNKSLTEDQEQSFFDLSRKTREALEIILFNTKAGQKISETDEERIKVQLIAILDMLCVYYKRVTGKKCRACIKTIYEDNKHIAYVSTYVRDSLSLEVTRHGIKYQSDLLLDNSDFDFLSSPTQDKGYFFSNNLQQDYRANINSARPYKNTSLPKKPFDPEKWPLPYKSSIVWPIRSGECIGFLALDTAETEAFIETRDIMFGQIVATHLYYIIFAGMEA